MEMKVQFGETNQNITANFCEVHNISDGGFERGYAAGYKVGNTEGYTKGHEDGVGEGYETGNAEGYAKGYQDGLTEREYETWTITLVDGTVVEKEVAML